MHRPFTGSWPSREFTRELGGVAGVLAATLARGRLIGVLERAVVRFKSLDDRDFAEYFLIGTLTSVLVALLVGAGVRLVLE
ncbi:MAG: hypothetical protein ACREMV_07505 [Gemmatimonadales bacterium]